MTDQEILQKHREKIENGVNKICKRDHIEDDSLREAVLHAYQKGFLEGFKEGREEERLKNLKEKREMVKLMISEGASLDFIQKVTRLDMKTIEAIKEKGSDGN